MLIKRTVPNFVQLGPVEIDPLESLGSEIPLSAITPPESVKWVFGGNKKVGYMYFSNFQIIDHSFEYFSF